MRKLLIEHYVPFFHDGAIITIEHDQNNITIAMQSAQIDTEDLNNNIILSRHHRIKGKLHLENIAEILINEIPYLETLKMTYDKGSIFDFVLGTRTIELQIAWVNFPPKPDINEFSIIKITAQNIWWENIPDLYDPFW